MRILYIEDSADNHFLISFYLKGLDVDIDFAETTDLALSSLSKNTYDLILLDWNLPGSITSLALLKHLKSETTTENIAIWIISAMQAIEIEPQIESFSNVLLLRKPIRKAEFLKRIKESFPNLSL